MSNLNRLNQTGYKDMNGRMICYGDRIEVKSAYTVGHEKLGTVVKYREHIEKETFDYLKPKVSYDYSPTSWDRIEDIHERAVVIDEQS